MQRLIRPARCSLAEYLQFRQLDLKMLTPNYFAKCSGCYYAKVLKLGEKESEQKRPEYGHADSLVRMSNTPGDMKPTRNKSFNKRPVAIEGRA